MSAVAILHPSGLLGKELRETLGAHHPEWADLRLLSTRQEEIGTLTEIAGAAALVGAYEPDSLQGVSIAFFCGAMADNRPLLAQLPPETTAIVLSVDAALEDGLPIVAGINTEAAQGRRVLLSPHPGVVLLAHLLYPLRSFALEEAVATLIQPVSMRDDPGLEELLEQTRQIVGFTRRTPTPVFGAQLAFNVLPTPLPAGPPTAQLRSILGEDPPVALQILQGPVFHGVSGSLFVRCAAQPSLQAIRKTLSQHPFLESADKPRHLGPVDAAASDKVLFGNVGKDEAGGGFWLWAVMDNLTRGGALNAIEIAKAV